MAQINKPNQYFNTKLWTGTGSSNALTGVGFQPDWTWIKNRTDANSHVLQDAVRGVGNTIISNNTDLQSAEGSGDLTAFGSDGFTVGTNGRVNGSGKSMVAWNWKAGTSFTNDASATGIGTIDSAGSFNNDSGFSIVSYTGTGSAGTIKHGLNSVPSIIIIKVLTNTANDWCVYHQATGNNQSTFLNGTNAVSSNAFMNNTTPTSSVFSVDGSNYSSGSSRNYIAYCFAEKKGYSKFGSYTGNGNADGTFVYTGFKPAFVMWKKSNSTSEWIMVDSKRNTYNEVDKLLRANQNSAENTYGACDFLSNGWKFRDGDTDFQASGDTYIYMAFAEEPLVGTNNIPATAR